jgi:hypothetical protein
MGSITDGRNNRQHEAAVERRISFLRIIWASWDDVMNLAELCKKAQHILDTWLVPQAEHDPVNNWRLRTTGVLILILLVILLGGIACTAGLNPLRWGILLCAFVLGWSIGWILGTLVSPYPKETKEFSALRGTIGGFLSGYVLSKIGDIAEWADKHNALQDTIVPVALMVAFASGVISLTGSFLYRRYRPETEDEKKQGATPSATPGPGNAPSGVTSPPADSSAGGNGITATPD